MAKVLCSISGLEFKTEHFPIYIESGYVHPIFAAPQKKLISYVSKWASGELTVTDSYLLFLALLNSTELINWRIPVKRTTQTTSIIANNMESLFKTIGKINVIKHPSFVLPQFVVSQDTASLENIHYWIDSWEQCIQDFQDGYKSISETRAILIREASLERLIKNATKDVSLYAHILADWAAQAGEFPTFLITTPEGAISSCSDYWKSIIRKCCKADSIFLIPQSDLTELITHCEDNILHGSIYAHSLMELLKAGKSKQTSYLGLGDADISFSTYRIISDEDTIENANKMALIDSAPEFEPSSSNYPSKLAYLRAKVKWDMKCSYIASQNLVTEVTEVTEVKGE